MSFTALKNVDSFLVAADLHEKAFDSVKWKFLRQTLESFKAGIRTFHSDISSCVMNNGFTSPLFQQTFSRVHRGDPLFPYLSIRVLEVLAINIRNDRTRKELMWKKIHEEIKLVMIFPDHLDTFLADSEPFHPLSAR